MKITREELEIRVIRELDNFYNYVYTSGEILRKQTAYYFLVKDLTAFENEGGDVMGFRDSFLNDKLKDKSLRNEQEDFIIDIIDFINKY